MYNRAFYLRRLVLFLNCSLEQLWDVWNYLTALMKIRCRPNARSFTIRPIIHASYLEKKNDNSVIRRIRLRNSVEPGGGQANPELYAIFLLLSFVFLSLLLFIYVYQENIFLILLIRHFISKYYIMIFHRI